MKLSQVAAQLYTVREFVKDAAGLAESARKLRRIGYQAVQASAVGPIPEEEILNILSGEGLTVCATHEPGEMIRNHPEKVVERLRKLKCRYTAYPYPAGVDFASAESVASLVADLEGAGAALRAAGMTLTYHNHAHEFYRINGTTVLDSIYARTSPENLAAEIDTYWVQAGGADPVAWCKKLAGRLPLLHMKDYAVGPDGKPRFAEIGSGNLDFKSIIAAAEQSGCEWFIIEQDTCPGDPFESLKSSFDYVVANLVE
jgi:sugar phosphate isomerase/epimerase